MARKTIDVIIEDGRDKGKKFRITEMSAMKAEKWARRAIFGAFSSGQASLAEIAEKIIDDAKKRQEAKKPKGKTKAEIEKELEEEQSQAEKLGMAYIADQGLKIIGRIPEETAESLYEELLTCVKYLPNQNDTSVERSIEEEDIEDPTTLIKLRVKAFMIHVDFFQCAES